MNRPDDQIPIQPVEDPILCSPYAVPDRHWVYDTRTGVPSKAPGRRDASYWYKSERTGSAQMSLLAEEERDDLPLVNALRADVRRWRESRWQGAAETTKRLLRHWWRADRSRRLFFCQVEAVETIIYLRELLARGRTPRWKPQLGLQEFELLGRGINPRPETWMAKVAQPPKLVDIPEREGGKPIPRYACKMATGSGKTVVMAMLIAWAFCNRGTKPGRPALPAPRAGGLPQPDDQGTSPGAASGRPAQLLRGVRHRAVAAPAGAGQGQGAGDQLASARPGVRGCDRRQGDGEPSRQGNARGVRAQPPGRPVGRRASAGPERRGAPCVPAGAGRGRRPALGGRKGESAGGDCLGRRTRHDQLSLRHRVVHRPVRDAVLHPGQRLPRGIAVSLDRQRLQPGRRYRKRDHEDSASAGHRQHRAPRPEVLQALAAHHAGSARRRAVDGRPAETGGGLPQGRRCASSRWPASGRRSSSRCGMPPPARTGHRRC